MGTFSVTIEVGDLDGRRFETLEALVDTGATYLVVPRKVLDSLEVEVAEGRPFELADGRQVQFDVGNVMLRLEGREHPVLTVFGDEETRALLGPVALETFGLAVDPINQRLVSVPGLLMALPAGRPHRGCAFLTLTDETGVPQDRDAPAGRLYE